MTETPATGTPEQRKRQARAKARLRALGIDVEQMEAADLRQAWEDARATYIQAAQAGRHMEPIRLDGDPLPGAPLHARYGMLHQALRDFHGAWPDDWSSPHIQWPGPHGHSTAGTRA